MATFLINYDLHHVRNYAPLYRLLAQWRAVRLTESSWIAQLNGPASIIRDIVRDRMDNDDSVAVLEIPSQADWATFNIKTAANARLATYVLPAQIAA